MLSPTSFIQPVHFLSRKFLLGSERHRRGLFLLRGLELKQRPFSIHILEVATRNRIIDVSTLEFSLPVKRDPAVHTLSRCLSVLTSPLDVLSL